MHHLMISKKGLNVVIQLSELLIVQLYINIRASQTFSVQYANFLAANK